MIQHISTQQAQELRCHNRVGRLGCVTGETPYVAPVSYLYDGEHIYMHSLAGRKVDAMRANPNVCLQADQVENEFHWDSVIAFGVYEEVTDAGERDRVAADLGVVTLKHPDQTGHGFGQVSAAELHDKRIVVARCCPLRVR